MVVHRWPLPTNDTPILAVKIDPPTAKPNVQVNTHIPITIGLGEGDWITFNDLMGIVEEVEGIVRGLRRWVEP